MLRSVAPAINLKTDGKNCSSGFLRSFYLASLACEYEYYSSATAYAANDNCEINTICVYLVGIARFTDQQTALTRAQGVILQSGVECARKNLIYEPNVSKTDPVTLPF